MANDRSDQFGESVFAKRAGAGDRGLRPSLQPSLPTRFEKKSYGSLKNSDRKASRSEVSEPRTESTVKSNGAAARGNSNGNSDKSMPARAEPRRNNKEQKLAEKNRRLLESDHWLLRRAHTLTYVGIFLFTFTLYFRPYELFPSLSGLSSVAWITAFVTFLIYLATQISKEGTLTAFTTEVKCILFIATWALLTIPIAKDPSLAWDTFAGTFSKVVLIFVIMLNVLRTRLRMLGLIWLGVAVALMLSYQAVDLYLRGEFRTEGYRVSVEMGGMFGNPNELAMHLAIFTPISVALALASRSKFLKILYFSSAAVMVVGNMVTQSRGGFLAILAAAGVLVWKLGRKKRLKAILILTFFGASLLAFAPANYGVRILSILNPALDPVGSASMRTELLKRSILVAARNPIGIGIGNFPVVGQRNLQSHNSYTQVASELGWLCLGAYLVLLVSPVRKLGIIERELANEDHHSWFYYLAIGIQASIAAYMVASFFGSVAYYWYMYYPIAFAVCLRRLYSNNAVETGIAGNPVVAPQR